MIASVNNFSHTKQQPTDYIAKHEVYKHPLVNRTMFKRSLRANKINHKTANTLYWLIVQAREQKDSLKFRVSNAYIQETVDCGYRTVSTYLRNLEAKGYIVRTPVYKSDGTRHHTTNYFEICWVKLYEDFGEYLFVDFMENMVTFIKDRIAEVKAFFNSLSLPIQQTDKLPSKEGTYIYNNISNFSPDSEGKSMTQEVLLKGEYDPDPLEQLLAENEAEKRTYFNREVRTCPDKWREIALKVGMAPEWIDDEFFEFRDYWIGRGKIKVAKKANWSKAWSLRIRDVINYPISRYKAVPSRVRQEEPIKLATDASRAHWDIGLIDHAFWDIPLGTDYTQFNGFYGHSGKGGYIMDTKEGWLARCHSFNKRSRVSIAAPKDERKIELNLPEQCRGVHKQILDAIGEPLYKAWIQDANICTTGATAMEDNLYVLQAASSFKEDRIKQDPMIAGVLNKLRISV